MKKRVWKALLCCVLAMAMLPAAAFAAPEADIAITDCGAWGEAHPGWFNVGWKYSDGFETDDITAIRVGMKGQMGPQHCGVHCRCRAGRLAEGQRLFNRWKPEQRAVL